MQIYLILHYFCTNIIVNCFALGIIFTKTPKNMRNVAATILNIIIWNFAGNIVWGIMPFYPLFPLNCYELQGPMGYLYAKYNLGEYGFILVVILLLNACIGVQLSFQFRWFQIAAPECIKSLKRRHAYLYSAATHAWGSALYYWFLKRVLVSTDEYPKTDTFPKYTPMFCMTPIMSKFVVLPSAIVGALFLASFIIIVLVISCYRALYQQRHIMSAATLELQRVFVKNLIVLAMISICVGAMASTTAWFCYLFHKPSLEYLCVCGMFIVMNHGTVLAIAAMIVFRYYRAAAVEIFEKLFRRDRVVFPTLFSSSSGHHSTVNAQDRRY